MDKDFYGVKLLGNILGNSPSSRLFQHIREEKGLSYSIYSSDSFYRNYAEFGIYASMAIDNLKEVYRLVKKEIADLVDNYITRDELLFAKEQYKGSVLMNIEDTEDRMLLIGEYEIEGKKLKSTEEISQIVDDIDIQRGDQKDLLSQNRVEKEGVLLREGRENITQNITIWLLYF